EVGTRLSRLGSETCRLVDRPVGELSTGECLLGRVCAEVRRADAGQRDTGGADRAVRLRDVNRYADRREVSYLAFQLEVRAGRIPTGIGDADLGDDLVRLERRREWAEEELVDGDDALVAVRACDYLRPRREQHRAPVALMIGMRDASG